MKKHGGSGVGLAKARSHGGDDEDIGMAVSHEEAADLLRHQRAAGGGSHAGSQGRKGAHAAEGTAGQGQGEGKTGHKRPREEDNEDGEDRNNNEEMQHGEGQVGGPAPLALRVAPVAPVALQGDPQYQAARRALPLYQHRSTIAAAVRNSAAVVLVGETGSGKTTQVPQLLVESGILTEQRKACGWRRMEVVVTQPRRVAAITLARRVAAEMGTRLGGADGRVGYTVRFDETTGPRVAVRFATDGILLREAMLDPLLSRIGVVVLDEAHERSLATDVLFGVVKRAQAARASGTAMPPVWVREKEKAEEERERADGQSGQAGSSSGGGGGGGFKAPPVLSPLPLPPLKVVVMSATLDVASFSSFFNASPLIIPGRSYPVDIMYAPEAVEDYALGAVTTVLQIAATAGSAPGDILVFLPGSEDIEDVEGLLKTKGSAMMAAAEAQGRGEEGGGEGEGKHKHGRGKHEPEEAQEPMLGLTVVPLYAALAPEAQLAAFEPAPPGTRKVILSTNIAETSVTINGVRYVVDSGKVKVRWSAGTSPGEVHSSANARRGATSGSGLETLALVDVSQAQATQRAGRAGREAPGHCYRLCTEEAFDALPPVPVPEIARVSLASLLLQLLGMGLPGTHALAFPFLEPPPPAALRRALCLLRDLGAVATIPAPAIGRAPTDATVAAPPKPVPAAAVPAAASSVAPPAATAPPASAPAMAALPDLPGPTPLPGAKPVEFGLTKTGRILAALPLDPTLSCLVLSCCEAGVGAVGCALAALLSGEAVFTQPGRDKEAAAAAARRAFISLEGDHLTLLNVFRAFERVVETAAHEASQAAGAILLSSQGFSKPGHGARAGQSASTQGSSSGNVGQGQEQGQGQSKGKGKSASGAAVVAATAAGAPITTSSIPAAPTFKVIIMDDEVEGPDGAAGTVGGALDDNDAAVGGEGDGGDDPDGAAADDAEEERDGQAGDDPGSVAPSTNGPSSASAASAHARPTKKAKRAPRDAAAVFAEAEASILRWAGRATGQGARQGASKQGGSGSVSKQSRPVRSCMDAVVDTGLAVARAAAGATSSAAAAAAGAGAGAGAGADAGAGASAAPSSVNAHRKACRVYTASLSKRVSAWCWDHFVSYRALRQAVSVRDQLVDMCTSLGLPLVRPAPSLTAAAPGASTASRPAPASTPAPTPGSRGTTSSSSSLSNEGLSEADVLRKALLAGCFLNVARRLPGSEGGARPQYRTLLGGITASVHPSSALVVAHAHARNRAAAVAARASRLAPSSVHGLASHSAALAAADSLAGYPDTVVFAELVQSAGGAGSGEGVGKAGAGAGAGAAGASGGRWVGGKPRAGGPVVYMRTVTRVETEWLSFVRPEFFATHA